MNPGLNVARIQRLCLKELRESLRDRRTIITLVLMPLLVYPLLSLILQRVLLTNQPAGSQEEFIIGVDSEQTGIDLNSMLRQGSRIVAALESAENSPLSSAAQPNSTALTPGGSRSEPATTTAATQLQIIVIDRDANKMLRDGAVDLMVTKIATQPANVGAPAPDNNPPATPPSTEGANDNDTSSSDDAKENPKTSDPAGKNLVAPPNPSQSANNSAQSQAPNGQIPPGRSRWRFELGLGPVTMQMRYRENDLRSEHAASFVERRLTLINEQLATQVIRQFRIPNMPAIGKRMIPVRITGDNVAIVATLVPLVLVLMTIAGAVYPAIDLTAGERERGTMEALIVSPTSSTVLLLAKYVAVVTVAMLTALANLLAMSVTLWSSGLGAVIFGAAGISIKTILLIFPLLILFAMFFSAVLLAITSFARSFKEAQAYLIPLMLLAMAPGVLSLLPGIEYNEILAVIPLVNIVLLAREVLTGASQLETSIIAVTSTAIYAIIAIYFASRSFGRDASLHGSQGSWRDLLRRPKSAALYPQVEQMAMTMAVMFPLYFVASTRLPTISESLPAKLALSALVSFLLIMGLPSLVSWHRRIAWRSTFLLRVGTIHEWLYWLPGLLLVGSSMWMIAHEIIILGKNLWIETLQFEQALQFKQQLQQLPLPFVLFVFALTPAICEEWFFRGFILASLRKYGMRRAIFGSAALFGLMHVLTSNVLAVERFLPTTFIGIVLAWIAWRSQCILPGIFLHAIHNSLLLAVGHFEDQLKAWGIGLEESEHLPATWLAGGCASLLVGYVILHLSTARRSQQPTST